MAEAAPIGAVIVQDCGFNENRLVTECGQRSERQQGMAQMIQDAKAEYAIEAAEPSFG